MAFSVEPGIYPGPHGARIEDIVVCTAQGYERLNHITRGARCRGRRLIRGQAAGWAEAAGGVSGRGQAFAASPAATVSAAAG